VLRLVAGLETGVLGGVAMLSWYALVSLLSRKSAWALPNLLTTVVFNRPDLRSGFGWPAVIGVALHLCAAGLIGTGFGIIAGFSRRRVRVVLLGLLTGLAWYYLSQALLWNTLGALSALYASPLWLLLGHLVYGAVLGWYPEVLQSVARAVTGHAAATETGTG
jgi:hypothetical protein